MKKGSAPPQGRAVSSRPPPHEVRSLARIQGNTNLAHTSAPPTIDQGSYTDTPPRVVVPVVRPPKPPTTGELRLPVGESIISRLVKPVGMALLLFASLAGAATSTITAPQGNKPATFPFGGGTGGLAAFIDVSQAPYNVVADFSGATNTGTDNAAAINRAIADACTTVAHGNAGFPPIIQLPPGRIRIASTITLLCSRLMIMGSGKGSTEIDALSVSTSGCGNGFSAFANRLNGGRTCKVSGAGACDSPINTAARGINCPCYQNADCVSGSCTGGTSINNVQIANLGLTQKNDCSVGFDMWAISESIISNVVSTSGVSPFATGVNSFNVLFSDSIGTIAAYSNLVIGSTFSGGAAASSITIDIESAGNDQRLIANTIKVGQIGVKCSKVGANTSNATRIMDSLIQSTNVSAIEDHCGGTQIANMRFEGPTAGINITSDAQRATIDNLYFDASVVAPITNAGTGTTVEGLPAATVALQTCTAAGGAGTTAGIRYFDTTIGVGSANRGGQACFCNGATAPKYCRDDTGVCGSATDCG
jgi:hypothetical protein